MKPIVTLMIITGILLSGTGLGRAQNNLMFSGDPNSVQAGLTGGMMGGVGVSFIEDDDGEMETWVNLNLQPELRFGKFGIGLHLDLLVNTAPDSGEDAIRTEDLEFTKIVRYLSYGWKGSKPLYARLGDLSGYSLGDGFLFYSYSNQINEDNRKLGLAVDVNLEKFGVETVTTDLGRLGIIGARPYVRPLKLANLNVPLLDKLEAGFTFVEDFDPDENTNTDDETIAYGIDLGLPVIQTKPLNLRLYWDWATITAQVLQMDGSFEEIDGAGQALGTAATFNGLGLLTLNARLERRWLGENFIPNYFNALYEVHRAERAQALQTVEEKSGTFGELGGDFLGKATLKGSYQYIDDIKYSGVFHAEASIPDAIPKIWAFAAYDRTHIETMTGTYGLFKVNQYSLAYVDVGYKLKEVPDIILVMHYEWSFRENEETGEIDTIQKITPRIQVNFTF